MSESMTSVEIEDVLSSIRRLVSEDLRPTHKLVSAALEKTASKLILTPALRIVSDVRTALPERGEGQGETRDLQSVLHEIEEEGSDAGADIMPMFGSVRLNEPFILTSPTQTDTADVITTGQDFLTTAMSRINSLSAGDAISALPVQAETIEAVVASVGAAVGLDEWEPDGGEPSPDTKSWSELPWNSEATANDDVFHAKMAGDKSLTENFAGSDDTVQTVAYDLQAETVIAATQTENYEKSVVKDSIVFQDAAIPTIETLVLEAPEVQTDDEDLDDATSFISEDLLREIVRDMIREELQGTLGERITRNVRKLVRSEINRALASRDFDDVASQG